MLYEAFALVKARRPSVCPNVGFMRQLCDLEIKPSISLEKYRDWYLEGIDDLQFY